jgi:hypothetical protein
MITGAAVEIEFSDPYGDILESFCEPEEPIRVISDLSFVSIYHGRITAQSADNRIVFDNLATVGYDPDSGEPFFTTPDGKQWAQISITRVP